jgi:cytochrome c oxidase subunit 1
LPEVHRWPYDYSVPGATQDFIPQTVPANSGDAPQTEQEVED